MAHLVKKYKLKFKYTKKILNFHRGDSFLDCSWEETSDLTIIKCLESIKENDSIIFKYKYRPDYAGSSDGTLTIVTNLDIVSLAEMLQKCFGKYLEYHFISKR